jgi:hypothetical protein
MFKNLKNLDSDFLLKIWSEKKNMNTWFRIRILNLTSLINKTVLDESDTGTWPTEPLPHFCHVQSFVFLTCILLKNFSKINPFIALNSLQIP